MQLTKLLHNTNAMEEVFRFRIERDNKKAIMITRMQSVKEDVWYDFEKEDQRIDKHRELCELPLIKQAITSLNKSGKFRQPRTTLTDEVQKLYCDLLGNFVFNGQMLEEASVLNKSQSEGNKNQSRDEDRDYLNRIRELESKLEERESLKLNDIERKFMIDKFDVRLDANDWVTSFEKECERYSINNDEKKIEALKLFLKESALDWYSICQKKLISNNWPIWKNAFISMFGVRSWSFVRQAYAFRYMGGSLINYALHKQKLLIETDDKMNDNTMINLIMYNLPSNIHEKLNRAELETIDDLYKELTKMNMYSEKPITYNEKSNVQKNKKIEAKEKIPCAICKKLGFDNRFHPIEFCRNRYMDKPNEQKRMYSKDPIEKKIHLNELDDEIDQIMKIEKNEQSD